MPLVRARLARLSPLRRAAQPSPATSLSNMAIVASSRESRDPRIVTVSAHPGQSAVANVMDACDIISPCAPEPFDPDQCAAATDGLYNLPTFAEEARHAGESDRSHSFSLRVSPAHQAPVALAADPLARAGHRLSRAPAHLPAVPRPIGATGQRADRSRRQGRRRGRRAGLGQPPLPRMLLRHSDDGRGIADGEPRPAARATPLFAERHRRHDVAAQCRFPAADRAAGVQAAEGEPLHSAQRPGGAAHDDAAGGRRIRGADRIKLAVFRLLRLRREDARRRSTLPAPPGSPRGCISAIARSCCTSSPH